MKISKHVADYEVQCKCCGQLPVGGMDPAVLELFERVRMAAGDKPLLIVSGYRCPKHNAKVDGAKDSQHMKGKALDVMPLKITVEELHEVADGLNPNGGVGKYKNFVHIDSRGKRARWKG